MRSVAHSASRLIRLILLASSLLFPAFVQGANPAAIPNPILLLLKVEHVTVGGKAVVRYHYDVLNSQDFPDALFAAAPALPPCGTNKNAARTWVTLYDQRGKRVNEFCGLKNNRDLNGLWFELPVDAVPPSYVYVELHDRQTDTKYKSNLADTTL